MGVLFSDDGRGFGQCRTIGSAEYWGDLAVRHREHRAHVRNLLIGCALLVVAGIVVHPSLLALVLVLVPLLAMEWFLLHRTADPAT